MQYTETILSIAKFMGITPMKGVCEETGNTYYYYNNPELQSYVGLPFYNTWEEIMPVVVKIESLIGDENKFVIFWKSVRVGDKEFVGGTKLEMVIKAVGWWVMDNCKPHGKQVHVSEIPSIIEDKPQENEVKPANTIPLISEDELTDYQFRIRTKLREMFHDLKIEVGCGERLLVNGEIMKGFLVSVDRNLFEYDIKVFANEIKIQYLDKL